MFIEYGDSVPEMPDWMWALWTPIFSGSLYEPPIPAPIWCGNDDEEYLKELEAMLAARDAEITQLHERIAVLSKLSVSMSGTPVTGPERLEIAQATVERLHIASLPLASPVIDAEPERNHEAPAPIAAPLNEAKFVSLKRRIQAVPSLHLKMLRVLTEREQMMSGNEIAAWLNVAESTIRSNPPYALLTMRLMERVRGRSGGYQYRSLAREHLAQAFPGVDVDLLVKRLFQ